MISAEKAEELHGCYEEGVRLGGIPLAHRALQDGRFLPNQDESAYVAPATILGPPSSWSLHRREPFGPLDSIVVVGSEPELIAAMNASNGA